MEDANIHGIKKFHVTIIIKAGLSVGICCHNTLTIYEQYVQLDFLFARTFLHCDNKPPQNWP